MKMKRIIALLLALVLVFALVGCGSKDDKDNKDTGDQNVADDGTDKDADADKEEDKTPEAEPVELIVFAAASMTESMTQIAEMYKAIAPNVTLVYNFDSSGTLKTQIQEGADCDIFISASQKALNQLDITAAEDVNTDKLDFVVAATRFNFVSNVCVLAVPAGSTKGITSFEDVNTDTVDMIALGNADVPAGQYAQEIFEHLGIWDAIQSKATFGANVKEVTTQVSENAVDCGIVYGTDALAAGLEIVAKAEDGWHTPVVYPAAVLNVSQNQEAAAAFCEYLQTAEVSAYLESMGFNIPA